MLGKIDIKIGGETRRLTFGQNAWYLFSKLQGIGPDKIRLYMSDQLANPTAFRDIIYCGLKAADLTQGKSIEYNEYIVGDWIDEADAKDISLVIVCIFESLGLATGSIKKKLGVEDPKKAKKQHGTTS